MQNIITAIVAARALLGSGIWLLLESEGVAAGVYRVVVRSETLFPRGTFKVVAMPPEFVVGDEGDSIIRPNADSPSVPEARVPLKDGVSIQGGAPRSSSR